MRRVALVLALCAAWGTSAPAQGDWTVTRDPFDPGVVRRYKAILANDPYDAGAIAALRKLYKRHRTLAQLEREYKELGNDWAPLVVLAQLVTDESDALALWKKAVIANDGDARAHLAIGKRTRDRKQALVFFQRARDLATTADVKREALVGVIDIVRLSGETPAIEKAYDALVELEPKNGRLWIERGDAMMNAGAWAAASTSYVTAEKLFATDPERRLHAIAQHARALAGEDHPDAALAEYERAIALAPKGYYLVRDLYARVIELHEGRSSLPDLLDILERRWPEKSRGFVEWTTLADIYEKLYDERAGDALRHAVAIDPTELDTQHRLVAMLDSEDRHADATAQLASAARSVPGAADLHIELAERYHAAKEDRLAVTTLQRLGKNVARNVGVRKKLAETFTKWGRPGLALRELEAVVAAEPDDDNLKRLGDAYWATGNDDKAFATWRRLPKTPEGFRQLGTIYTEHEQWTDAIAAYTRAIKLDDKNADMWRVRSDLFESLERWAPAIDDAKRAVALLDAANLDGGHAVRYQLIRVLARASEHDTTESFENFEDYVERWRLAFAQGDVKAGYLLVEYYERTPSAELATTLEQLRKLVPKDRGVVMALIRAYRVIGMHDLAIALVRELAAAEPARAAEHEKMIADIKHGKVAYIERVGWTNENIVDPMIERRSTFRDDRRLPLRWGIRMGVGVGLRGGNNDLLVGVFATPRLTSRLAFVARLDWAQHTVDEANVNGVAISTGVSAHLATTKHAIFALGAAHRTELRVGELMTNQGPWDRIGLAGDVTFDVIAREAPIAWTLRLEQGLSDHGRNTTAIGELTFELH